MGGLTPRAVVRSPLARPVVDLLGGPVEVIVTQHGDDLEAIGTIGWWGGPHRSGSATGAVESGTLRFHFGSVIGSGTGKVSGKVLTGEGRVKPPLLRTREVRGKGFTFTGRFTSQHGIYGSFLIAGLHVGSVKMGRVLHR